MIIKIKWNKLLLVTGLTFKGFFKNDFQVASLIFIWNFNFYLDKLNKN